MKRFLALVALVLGLVACQTEPEGLDVIVGGEVDTVVSVSLPEATRASSAVGFDLTTLDDEDSKYKLRYILEIYRVENGITDYNTCQRHTTFATNANSVSFPVRLAPGRDYTFVAWADLADINTTDSNEVDRYYNTQNGLGNITIVDNTWNAMDESRDAFTAKETRTGFSAQAVDLHLKRPFAKLRVVATDYDDVDNLGLTPASAVVTYSQKMPHSFNALTGIAGGAADKSHNITYPATPVYNDATGEYTLFADYFFVPTSGTAKFSLNVYADAGLIKANNFNTEIFVEANKLTTIKGDVLTIGGNVSIVIENGLGELKTINYADNAETLQEIINEAPVGEQTNITLGGDIDLDDLLNAGISSTRASEPTYGLLISEDQSIVLDLNGHTISQSVAYNNHYGMIQNNGTLTINDSSSDKNGAISFEYTGQGDANFTWGSYTINNNGTLVVNGGKIENICNQNSSEANVHMYCAIQQGMGSTTINGGVISTPSYRSVRINSGSLLIKGGNFEGQIWMQPNSESSITIEGGNFAPRGGDMSSVYVENTSKTVACDIKGGFFNTKIGMSVPIECITAGTFTNAAKEGTNESLLNSDYKFVHDGENWGVTKKDPIAKIGETEYRSLQKAVNNAVNGDTITFVMDVKQADGVVITDKNITIDLGGKTFTVTEGANTNNRNFKVNGSSVVTIKNGTMVAAGEYSSGAYGTLRTEGTANVTLEDVELYNYRGNGLNVKVCTGTTVTINNTNIYSVYGGGVEAAGGTVELTNVKIEQKGMYTAPYNSMAISVNGGGTATVISGTYSTECLTTEEANNQGTSHGPWCAGVLNSGGTLIINGGTFSNDNFGDNALATYGRGLLLADTGANIQINGGTFNAVKAIIDVTNNLGDASKNPSATISGGTFSADPRISGLYASELITVAEGYVVDEEDGIYSVVEDVKVAKVGNTEYRKIDAAIAAWTNNTTLTLLNNVTLSDVVTLKSTEHHILDLGTYTLTAAEGKNAFVIKACGTGDAERTAITIKADATNPGGIDAGKKSIVYYKYADGGISGNDRPIIKIQGGVFNGSTSSWGTAGIYFIGGSKARQAATLQIEGGEFHCSINGSGKSKLIISGGLFHYSVGSQGDMTALRLISGGTFKSFGFMTADSDNTKFWFGTSMANSNVGLYINDDNYLVVGGPVITEFGDKFAAKATNATEWSHLLQYSSAAANGLYYTNADMAIKKHGADNVELK